MSEVLTPLYDKKEKCLMCDHSFTSKKLRTRFVKLERTDTDFCPTYKDEELSPILYFVKVCPNCGYSFTEQFSSYFPHGTKDDIRELIQEKWVPHDFSDFRSTRQAIQTYKLGILSANLKQEKKIIVAGLLTRLAWLYRKQAMEKEEFRFLALAKEAYKDAYSEGGYGDVEMSDVKILYLIGEISRRIGNLDEAAQHFSKVIERQNSTIEHKIVEMAREQWYIIRDSQKSDANDDNS